MMMLALIGFVCQLKITHYAYKVSINHKISVDKKFECLYADYFNLKKEAETSIEETIEAHKKNKIRQFKNNLENAEFEYKFLYDKLKSIENDIYFTLNEIPVFSKIFSSISFFGNLWIQYYRYLNSTNSLISNIFGIALVFIFSVFGLYFAYNKRIVNEKIKIINLEKVNIEKSLKCKIDMLKKKDFL